MTLYTIIYNAYIEPEIPPNSISEHLFFKIFLGGMPPDPPSIRMLHMLIVLRTIAKEHHFNYVPSLLIFFLMAWPHKSRLLRPCHSQGNLEAKGEPRTTNRPQSIMLKILPIMLLSNAQKICPLCSILCSWILKICHY